MIEDEMGQVYHEEVEIADVINKYYNGLFTSIPQERDDILNQALSPIITT